MCKFDLRGPLALLLVGMSDYMEAKNRHQPVGVGRVEGHCVSCTFQVHRKELATGGPYK